MNPHDFLWSQDFKSCASAISPHRHLFIYRNLRSFENSPIDLVLLIAPVLQEESQCVAKQPQFVQHKQRSSAQFSCANLPKSSGWAQATDSWLVSPQPPFLRPAQDCKPRQRPEEGETSAVGGQGCHPGNHSRPSLC